MKRMPTISMLIRPRVCREVALEGTESAAAMVNAVAGAFIVAALSISLLPLFTVSLAALLPLLLGPLAGFTVSSLYSRVEWTVGKRLGGNSSRDEVYRLFAWSFLQVGVAALLLALILTLFQTPSVAIRLAASVPSLLILFCSIRNYCSSITTIQHFTRARGCIAIVVSLFLFLVLVAGGATCLSLLFSSADIFNSSPVQP